MSTASLQFTFLACADLKATWEAIAMPADLWGDTFTDKLSAAREFAAGFSRHCEMLAENPDIGSPRDDLRHGLRSSAFRKHVIFYRVRGDAVEVLRVLRAMRDAEPLA
jgi:toxin ParE1/3/4